MSDAINQQLQALSPQFAHWEKTKDLIDQLLDIILNYRQSGHPGGSRSKVHILVTTLLGGAMRWDIRNPEKRFGDRFVLGAGHTIPLIYCTLAVLNEALRIKLAQTGDSRYAIPGGAERTLLWEDLLGFRRRGGLSGHAEMAGKTLFLKFNTGPSGHGGPAAAGEALALKRAGAAGVKVFFLEGEGGLTPGGVFETLNSAWGLALDNLYFLIDWNDFGIDDHPVSAAMPGTPADWFGGHGWRVVGTEQGMDWAPVTETLLALTGGANPDRRPSAAWFKTRKGRGYLKYDNPVHGVPHKMNSEIFWETKRPFAEQYGAQFVNFGGAAPADPAAQREEFKANLAAVIDVLRQDQALVDYLADRLVALGDGVPEEMPGFKLETRGHGDTGIVPRPRPKSAHPLRGRAALRLPQLPGRPLRCARRVGGEPGGLRQVGRVGQRVRRAGVRPAALPGRLSRSVRLDQHQRLRRALRRLPRLRLVRALRHGRRRAAAAGDHRVRQRRDVDRHDDRELRPRPGAAVRRLLGRVLDLRLLLLPEIRADAALQPTRAGLRAQGRQDDLGGRPLRPGDGGGQPDALRHLLARRDAALPRRRDDQPAPVGVQRGAGAPRRGAAGARRRSSPCTSPGRRSRSRIAPALGMPSHFEAARGAYVIRDHQPGPRGGTVIVQGASAVANIIAALPELDARGLNVKIVCATSPQLFALQPEEYRRSVLAPADYADSTVITTQARWLMHDWLFNKVAEAYALSADWDDRWRTGGAVDEVLDEAHLTPAWIVKGIERFVSERPARLACLRDELDAASGA